MALTATRSRKVEERVVNTNSNPFSTGGCQGQFMQESFMHNQVPLAWGT